MRGREAGTLLGSRRLTLDSLSDVECDPGSEVIESKVGRTLGCDQRSHLAPQRCRELRNFSSLRAILSALQSHPIYRLKSSWGAVGR